MFIIRRVRGIILEFKKELNRTQNERGRKNAYLVILIFIITIRRKKCESMSVFQFWRPKSEQWSDKIFERYAFAYNLEE